MWSRALYAKQVIMKLQMLQNIKNVSSWIQSIMKLENLRNSPLERDD